MGDRIAILRDGRLVQYDTPDTILAHPIDKFVRDFVGTDRTLKRLELIRINTLMSKKPPTCTISSTIEEVKKCLDEYNVRSVFVIDEEDGTLKGWVDREQAESSSSLVDAMYEAPFSDIAIREDATARDALSAMVARGFRITPVVNREGKLVGTVTMKELQDLAEQEASPWRRSNGGTT